MVSGLMIYFRTEIPVSFLLVIFFGGWGGYPVGAANKMCKETIKKSSLYASML